MRQGRCGLHGEQDEGSETEIVRPCEEKVHICVGKNV